MSVILVTGSSRGIGFGIAEAFASQGGTVILNARQDEAQLSAAISNLREKYKGNVMGYIADLADYSAAANLFRQIEADYGGIDVVVNNAGASYFGLFSDMSQEQILKVFADNLLTTVNTSHLAVPYIRAAKGCIINITSVWGVVGASCEVMYSTAKAGIIGFTKALAKELAPCGVRVNAIACGAFDTRMNARLSPEERADFTNGIPMSRFGNPSEVGDLAVFLASNQASYMTGQVIGLDGGL